MRAEKSFAQSTPTFTVAKGKLRHGGIVALGRGKNAMLFFLSAVSPPAFASDPAHRMVKRDWEIAG